VRLLFQAQALGDPEVGQVGVAVLIQQDICRLDVAVHHPGPMCSVQRAADLLHQPYHRFQRQWPLPEQHRQAAAAQEAHGQVGHSRLTPVVVQRHDVRMLQPGHQLRLRLKTADEVGTVGQLRQNDLEGDLAADQRLKRPVDDAETAGADPLAELIAADSPAGQIRLADFLR
jgi:hypothetical protein